MGIGQMGRLDQTSGIMLISRFFLFVSSLIFSSQNWSWRRSGIGSQFTSSNKKTSEKVDIRVLQPCSLHNQVPQATKSFVHTRDPTLSSPMVKDHISQPCVKCRCYLMILAAICLSSPPFLLAIDLCRRRLSTGHGGGHDGEKGQE